LLNLQRAAGNQAVTGLLHLTHVPDVPESDWLSGLAFRTCITAG